MCLPTLLSVHAHNPHRAHVSFTLFLSPRTHSHNLVCLSMAFVYSRLDPSNARVLRAGTKACAYEQRWTHTCRLVAASSRTVAAPNRYTTEELASYRKTVVDNLVQSMAAILEGMQ